MERVPRLTSAYEYAAAISAAVHADVPLLIIGPPGAGKSEIAESTLASAGYKLVTRILSGIAPEEFTGAEVPDMRELRGRRLKPEWLIELEAAANEGYMPALFLDELTCAFPPVRAAALRVVAARRAQQFPLPPRTYIIAAANPPEYSPGGSPLEPPEVNRFCCLQFNGDYVASLAGPALYGTYPEYQFRFNGRRYEPLRARFLRAALYTAIYDSRVIRADSITEGPFCSPRSIQYAARMYASSAALGLHRNLIQRLIAGTIGEQAAESLCTAVRSKQEFPSPLQTNVDPNDLSRTEKELTYFAALASAGLLTREEYINGITAVAQLLYNGYEGAIAARASQLRAGAIIYKIRISDGRLREVINE